MHVVGRLIINAAALWVATRIVPGISFTGEWWLLFAVALVFGALNVAVKPILVVLTFPFLLLTLGFFLLVLNGVMLWLTSKVSDALGLGFHVTDFTAAFVGGLTVSIVSFILSMFVASEQRHPNVVNS
jgi:putative membrane protein